MNSIPPSDGRGGWPLNPCCREASVFAIMACITPLGAKRSIVSGVLVGEIAEIVELAIMPVELAKNSPKDGI